ncbi:MAG: hypothetical protein G01um10147_169 [Microgenomates group bacterium Gr01-1014_7]|nr:MAG: hypothetical protein G01um10147_169 [Microgenomates group bacterium Gr01-1014_7]
MAERKDLKLLRNISQTFAAAFLFLAPVGSARAESEVRVDFEVTCRPEAAPLLRLPNPWLSIRGIRGISEEEGEVFLVVTNTSQEREFVFPYFEYIKGFQEAGVREMIPLAVLQAGQEYTVSLHKVLQRTPTITILEWAPLYRRNFRAPSCAIPYNVV